jgi:hypothetical protein
VGLERGPLNLVRIIKELLKWRRSGSGQENRINDRGGGIRCAVHATPSLRKKLALALPASGGHSVGIVRLRTKGHGGVMVRLLVNKELGRMWKLWSWLNRGTVPAFAWRDWRKPRKASVKIASIPAEIQAEHLPNTCIYSCSGGAWFKFGRHRLSWLAGKLWDSTPMKPLPFCTEFFLIRHPSIILSLDVM